MLEFDCAGDDLLNTSLKRPEFLSVKTHFEAKAKDMLAKMADSQGITVVEKDLPTDSIGIVEQKDEGVEDDREGFVTIMTKEQLGDRQTLTTIFDIMDSNE